MNLIVYPHPVLRTPSKTIKTINRELRQLAAIMHDQLIRHNGVGLAAPQLGVPISMFVINYTSKIDNPTAITIINPMIIDAQGSLYSNEGCLSLPGIYKDVKRHNIIAVRYNNLDGDSLICHLDSNFVNRTFTKPSIVWQHEIDHLNGELLIDKNSSPSIPEKDILHGLRGCHAKYLRSMKTTDKQLLIDAHESSKQWTQ